MLQNQKKDTKKTKKDDKKPKKDGKKVRMETDLKGQKADSTEGEPKIDIPAQTNSATPASKAVPHDDSAANENVAPSIPSSSTVNTRDSESVTTPITLPQIETRAQTNSDSPASTNAPRADSAINENIVNTRDTESSISPPTPPQEDVGESNVLLESAEPAATSEAPTDMKESEGHVPPPTFSAQTAAARDTVPVLNPTTPSPQDSATSEGPEDAKDVEPTPVPGQSANSTATSETAPEKKDGLFTSVRKLIAPTEQEKALKKKEQAEKRAADEAQRALDAQEQWEKDSLAETLADAKRADTDAQKAEQEAADEAKRAADAQNKIEKKARDDTLKEAKKAEKDAENAAKKLVTAEKSDKKKALVVYGSAQGKAKMEYLYTRANMDELNMCHYIYGTAWTCAMTHEQPSAIAPEDDIVSALEQDGILDCVDVKQTMDTRDENKQSGTDVDDTDLRIDVDTVKTAAAELFIDDFVMRAYIEYGQAAIHAEDYYVANNTFALVPTTPMCWIFESYLVIPTHAPKDGLAITAFDPQSRANMHGFNQFAYTNVKMYSVTCQWRYDFMDTYENVLTFWIKQRESMGDVYEFVYTYADLLVCGLSDLSVDEHMGIEVYTTGDMEITLFEDPIHMLEQTILSQDKDITNMFTQLEHSEDVAHALRDTLAEEQGQSAYTKHALDEALARNNILENEKAALLLAKNTAEDVIVELRHALVEEGKKLAISEHTVFETSAKNEVLEKDLAAALSELSKEKERGNSLEKRALKVEEQFAKAEGVISAMNVTAVADKDRISSLEAQLYEEKLNTEEAKDYEGYIKYLETVADKDADDAWNWKEKFIAVTNESNYVKNKLASEKAINVRNTALLAEKDAQRERMASDLELKQQEVIQAINARNTALLSEKDAQIERVARDLELKQQELTQAHKDVDMYRTIAVSKESTLTIAEGMIQRNSEQLHSMTEKKFDEVNARATRVESGLEQAHTIAETAEKSAEMAQFGVQKLERELAATKQNISHKEGDNAETSLFTRLADFKITTPFGEIDEVWVLIGVVACFVVVLMCALWLLMYALWCIIYAAFWLICAPVRLIYARSYRRKNAGSPKLKRKLETVQQDSAEVPRSPNHAVLA